MVCKIKLSKLCHNAMLGKSVSKWKVTTLHVQLSISCAVDCLENVNFYFVLSTADLQQYIGYSNLPPSYMQRMVVKVSETGLRSTMLHTANSWTQYKPFSGVQGLAQRAPG